MCSIGVGDTATVERAMGNGRFKLSGSGGSYKPEWFELVSAPSFQGTYAERQKQWIEHHGLEVGDMVRVVREFESREDGSSCAGWRSTPAKASAQGNSRYIRSILSKEIVLCEKKGQRQGCGTFPYFALEPVK
jgi:hypothetical protein